MLEIPFLKEKEQTDVDKDRYREMYFKLRSYFELERVEDDIGEVISIYFNLFASCIFL